MDEPLAPGLRLALVDHHALGLLVRVEPELLVFQELARERDVEQRSDDAVDPLPIVEGHDER